LALKKIAARNTFAPQVYDELRRAVLRGSIPPGTRLVESRIAEQMGVSRTPVREAISRLVAQGFVKEDEGYRLVADMSVELHDIFCIRQALEGQAAALAAQVATDEEITELESMCNTSLEALHSNSVEERAAFNSMFHGSIAKASHNQRLIKLIAECYEYSITEEMLPFYSLEATAEHVQQHLDIMQALKNRDAEQAERAMKRHVVAVERVISGAVERVRGVGGAEMDGRSANPSGKRP
jgi:DNA-binding GntR family transcriptional regulator